jgi:hypothetical protein
MTVTISVSEPHGSEALSTERARSAAGRPGAGIEPA